LKIGNVNFTFRRKKRRTEDDDGVLRGSPQGSVWTFYRVEKKERASYSFNAKGKGDDGVFRHRALGEEKAVRLTFAGDRRGIKRRRGPILCCILRGKKKRPKPRSVSKGRRKGGKAPVLLRTYRGRGKE